MASVQFFGKDATVKAAENGGFNLWALFVGRQLLFKNVTDEKQHSLNFLDRVLEDISHSEATYTLKFYEPEGKGFKIKENTPCDASFNFRLVEEEERQQRQLIYKGNNVAMMEELKEIRLQLAEIREREESEEDEPEPLSLNGIIAGLLKEPQKIGQLFEIGRSIFGNKTTVAAAVGNIPNDTTMNEQEQINKAIETLKKNDAKIAEHLTKLADLSENDKNAWKYLLNLLDQR